MPKRGRRAGVSFIEDSRGRGLTFFKRRSGLFKAASDLSTLTGVRVAVVLESENERFSSFGTPDASPIVDAFLSGGVPTESDTSEEQKAKITDLQNELFQLEKDKAMADKRHKENAARAKEAQEASRTAKYAYGKEEDLDATELYEMYRKLTWVMQEIKDCSPTLLRGNHGEAAGGRLRDPSLLQPKWWCSSPASQFAPPPPPKYSPLSLSQASFQQHYPWASTSHHPMLARSGSSLPNPLMLLPSQQHHPLAPHAPSILRLQAPSPKEAYPYNYHSHGLDINRNSSHPLSFSPVSPATPPQPSSLQTPPSYGSSPPFLSPPQLSSPPHQESPPFSFNPQNCNFAQPPHHNYANASSPLIPSHHPFYSSSPGLNGDLGNTGGNGGQTGGGHSRGFDLSTSQQGHDGPGVILESSAAGESSGAGNAGSNLGDFNFPCY